MSFLKISTKEEFEELNNAIEHHNKQTDLKVYVPINNTNLASSEDVATFVEDSVKPKAKYDRVLCRDALRKDISLYF